MKSAKKQKTRQIMLLKKYFEFYEFSTTVSVTMYNILESWWWSFSFQFFMVCSMRSWLFCCRWPLLVFLEWLWMQFLTCRSPCCQICHRQRRRRTFLVWLKTRWVRGSRNGTFSSITWPKRGTLEIKTRRTQLTRENFYLSFLGNTRKRNFHFKNPFFLTILNFLFLHCFCQFVHFSHNRVDSRLNWTMAFYLTGN